MIEPDCFKEAMERSNPTLEPIRQAVAAADFPRAQQLWAAYIAHLIGELERGRVTTAQADEAGDLIAWARRVILCRRTHLQEHWNQLQAAGMYNPQKPEDGPQLVLYRL